MKMSKLQSPALDDQGRPVEAAVAVSVDFQEAR